LICGAGRCGPQLRTASGGTEAAPADTGYAVFGIGAVGVPVAGLVLFCEAVTVARVLFLSIMVVGTVGLRLAEG